jgi:hypothetical protein
MTIIEFCDKHRACVEGREWAIDTGCQTMADLWARTDIRPEWRIWIATRPGVMTDREARLFACWCVRQVWHLRTDQRSRTAIEVAERYADGQATDAELAAACWVAAMAAAWAASGAVARCAALDAAWAAQGDYLRERGCQAFMGQRGEG